MKDIFPIEELSSLANRRKKPNLQDRVHHKILDEKINEGWKVVKKGRKAKSPKYLSVERPKAQSSYFEDRVWSLLYVLGFTHISGENGARVPFGPQGSDEQEQEQSGKDPVKNQLDIVAIDNDVILGIECKTQQVAQKRSIAAQEFAKLNTLRNGLQSECAKSFPADKRRRTAMIYFSQNIQLSDNDEQRAKELNIKLYNEDDLIYFEKLFAHLGRAAKYLLLANIFADRSIESLKATVPAVKIKVGGNDCYILSLKPSYLLKIANVAHRTAGRTSSQAYQRILDKTKLRDIRHYLSEDGFFPTNILLNFTSDCLTFERAHQKNENDGLELGGTLGWLTIKPAYGCAWVIDGQHRLYAYADHENADRDRLTVLAFDDLEISDQIRLFVDINSKQKAVKKALLTEIMEELNWDSEDPRRRAKAVAVRVIRELDSRGASPLCGRIEFAETEKTDKRCISLHSLDQALCKKLLSVEVNKKSGQVVSSGVLWTGENTSSVKRATLIVSHWLSCIRDCVPDWWGAGQQAGAGGLSMSGSVQALVEMLSRVLVYLEEREGHKIRALQESQINELIEKFALVIGMEFSSWGQLKKDKYRKLFGPGGVAQRVHILTKVVNARFSDFKPAGFEEEEQKWRESASTAAREIVAQCELRLQEVVRKVLYDRFGSDEWWSEGVPQSVRQAVRKKQEDAKASRDDEFKFFDILDYYEVVRVNRDIFVELNIGFGDKQKSWAEQLSWIKRFSEIRNGVMHASKMAEVTEEVLESLEEYKDHIGGVARELGLD